MKRLARLPSKLKAVQRRMRSTAIINRLMLLWLVAVLATGTLVTFLLTEQQARDQQAEQTSYGHYLGQHIRHQLTFYLKNPEYRPSMLGLSIELDDISHLTEVEQRSELPKDSRSRDLTPLRQALERQLSLSLPDGWQYVLVEQPIRTQDKPPHLRHFDLNHTQLFLQVPLPNGHWLELDRLLLGAPAALKQKQPQWLFALTLAPMLMPIAYLMIKREIYPLERLTDKANLISRDLYHPPLPATGAEEIVAVTQALNRMQERLKRYIRDREEMLSSISHDLKTPVTRMRLRVELLDDEELYQKFSKDLDELELMVHSAVQGIKDGTLQEGTRTVDLDHMLQEICNNLNTREHRASMEGGLKYPYRGKPVALHRCLTNLMENGVKYGDRIEVTLTDLGVHLEISIRDHGPGMTVQELERVFEPYQRFNQKTQGHGLGLHIARTIAHAHGGEITMRNHHEGGIEALLQLPRA